MEATEEPQELPAETAIEKIGNHLKILIFEDMFRNRRRLPNSVEKIRIQA
jgi:hypothetical protein